MVGSIEEIGNRAANMAVVNLIPLLFSRQLSLVADLLGVSLRLYQQMHGSIGIMASLQALTLTHVLIFRTRHSFAPGDVVQFSGFLIRLAPGSLLPLANRSEYGSHRINRNRPHCLPLALWDIYQSPRRLHYICNSRAPVPPLAEKSFRAILCDG